jgi:predicted Zn-dependent protease
MKHWAVLLLVAAIMGGCKSGEGFKLGKLDVASLVEGAKGLREVQEPEEIQIGTGVAETLLGASPLYDDGELQRYVNEVGMWVAQQSERPGLPWQFGVNNSDHINAFAAPGGVIIVTRGMMAQLRNEAELAGVLGHEVAHVTRKHHLNALRKNAVMSLIGTGVSAASAESKHADLVKKLMGPTRELYARGLDKADEYEADRIGVVLAARAGYDPFGLPTVLTTLASADPQDNFLSLMYKTHPLPQARLDRLVPGLSTLEAIKAPQNSERFQQMVRKLQMASVSTG